jgi:superfamily I DNA and/or RNA helicase
MLTFYRAQLEELKARYQQQFGTWRRSGGNSSSSDRGKGGPRRARRVDPNVLNSIVHTVDSFQGSESKIVLLSFGRSHDSGGKHGHGFLEEFRRLNVALTRAKEGIVVFANVKGLLERSKKDEPSNEETVKCSLCRRSWFF